MTKLANHPMQTVVEAMTTMIAKMTVNETTVAATAGAAKRAATQSQMSDQAADNHFTAQAIHQDIASENFTGAADAPTEVAYNAQITQAETSLIAAETHGNYGYAQLARSQDDQARAAALQQQATMNIATHETEKRIAYTEQEVANLTRVAVDDEMKQLAAAEDTSKPAVDLENQLKLAAAEPSTMGLRTPKV